VCSEHVYAIGTAEGQANDSEGRAIADLSGLNDGAEAVDPRLRGTMEGVEGEDGPGNTPGSEEGIGATLQPVEARSYEVVERLAQERKQGHGCRIGMRS